MVEFWRLYKQVDQLRRQKGNDMWPEAIRLCSRFGEHWGDLAKKLTLAMCDEFERRLKHDQTN